MQKIMKLRRCYERERGSYGNIAKAKEKVIVPTTSGKRKELCACVNFSLSVLTVPKKIAEGQVWYHNSKVASRSRKTGLYTLLSDKKRKFD